jgi:hypothetical protein
MTVSELISKLQSCPPNARVVVHGGEDGYNDATSAKEVHLALYFSDACWRGRHQDADAICIDPEWNGVYEFAVCVS